MYRYFTNLNIKTRLIATSVLCAVLVGGFVILFFPYNQRLQIRGQAIEKTRAIAVMTADNLAASIVFQDHKTASEILDVLAANPDLLFAVVRTAGGGEFARIRFVFYDDDQWRVLAALNLIDLSCGVSGGFRPRQLLV